MIQPSLQDLNQILTDNIVIGVDLRKYIYADEKVSLAKPS